MNLINTHSHVYAEQFEVDRIDVVNRAIENGVSKILLPDIDSTYREKVIALSQQFPKVCYPMFGIHPTSIKENFKEELMLLEQSLKQYRVIAIGEIGIDLYWDKTFLFQQIEAFVYQMQLANQYKLPVVIHVRDAFDEIFVALKSLNEKKFFGVFHCFSGNVDEAIKAIDLGFMLGIGGVLTYKKSGLEEVVKDIPIEHIVLETDDPWLSPVPFRGKRNEPSYLIHIAQKLAEIKNCSVEEIARITTQNAEKLFKIN